MTKNRITEAQVDALLDQSIVTTTVMHGKETLSTFLLPSGFTLTGRSACVDPANFDAALGIKLAREDAKRQLWAFEGYRLQCQLADQQPVVWDGNNIVQVTKMIADQHGLEGESFVIGDHVHIHSATGTTIAKIGDTLRRTNVVFVETSEPRKDNEILGSR